MKKFFYYFLLAAVSVSFYSCSNDKDEPVFPIGGEEPVDSVPAVETASFFILNQGASYDGIDGTLAYYNYSIEDYSIVK